MNRWRSLKYVEQVGRSEGFAFGLLACSFPVSRVSKELFVGVLQLYCPRYRPAITRAMLSSIQ